MSKCDNCTHKNVCKLEKDMQKFEKEIAEKVKLMEYVNFSANIECKHWNDTGIRGTAVY